MLCLTAKYLIICKVPLKMNITIGGVQRDAAAMCWDGVRLIAQGAPRLAQAKEPHSRPLAGRQPHFTVGALSERNERCYVHAVPGARNTWRVIALSCVT